MLYQINEHRSVSTQVGSSGLAWVMARRPRPHGRHPLDDATAAADRRVVSTKANKGAARGPRASALKRTSLSAVVADVDASKRARRVPGRAVAIVPLADLRRLRRLEREDEDRADLVAARKALADPARVPYERGRRELGLDRT